MNNLWLAFASICTIVAVVSQSPAPATPQQNAPSRPKRPGVSTPGVKIPITKLKPDAVFSLPGVPDWLAIDEHVWVSNSPKNTVHRLDPKLNTVAATIQVGMHPCSGLAVGFGSLWVPNCGDKSGGRSVMRVSLADGKVEATLPFEVPESEGGLATGAGSVWVMTDKN